MLLSAEERGMEKQKNKDAIIISVGGSKLNPRMICYSPLERKLTQGLLIRESWVRQLTPSNPRLPIQTGGLTRSPSRPTRTADTLWGLWELCTGHLSGLEQEYRSCYKWIYWQPLTLLWQTLL